MRWLNAADILHLFAKPRSEKKRKPFFDHRAPGQYEISVATKNMPHVHQNTPVTTLEQVKSIDVGYPCVLDRSTIM